VRNTVLTTTQPLVRSWLYVPGQRERMLQKSFELTADAVIYDLEDAVPIAEKQAARDLLAQYLTAPAAPGAPRRFVRLNHPSHAEIFEADLACAVALSIEGIGLPKVETADEIHSVDAALTHHEQVAAVEPGSTRIMLLIESPLGLVNAYAIASASPRIVAIAFGAEDFSREMGLPLVKEAEAKDQLFARSTIAIAAAAAGVQAIDIIWTNLSDNDGIAAEAAQARRLGYTGKAAIHPDQIAPINAAFSPSEDEIAYAHEVLAVYNAAVAEGTGAINYKGAFLEEPVIARARHVLELADRAI
jgi:citrate lyase subunit beta/citryl-CoA lyase